MIFGKIVFIIIIRYALTQISFRRKTLLVKLQFPSSREKGKASICCLMQLVHELGKATTTPSG